MRAFLRAFFYSLPVQLLLLHFRKYQILLVFWLVLFSTINGGFMKSYGADSLFLAPEYLDSVNSLSTAMVGMAIGMFIMSWNITTFILFSRHCRFLATTSQPFVKFCINNAIIPLVFLIFYFIKAVGFDTYKELIPLSEVLFLTGGFLSGLLFIIAVSFLYFFGANKTIQYTMAPIIKNPDKFREQYVSASRLVQEKSMIKAEWYLNTLFKPRKPRNVAHYNQSFIDAIFKRHHIAAVISIVLAFFFLLTVGFFLDNRLFQIPAAASVTIFFAILIGVSGAIGYFLESWSMPVLVVIFLVLNWLYQQDIIDPRNKAYGLNYTNVEERPAYSRDHLLTICRADKQAKDKAGMTEVLNNWKRRQQEEKPLLFLINTSGGGNRSATFTMNVLQRLDSMTKGSLMKHTVLITGASGGMLGATYFRELYLQQINGSAIRLSDPRYVDDISKDLLNPMLSSFVARDLTSPVQKFTVAPYRYIKDRGYAFEEKLNDNTRGYMNKQLRDYQTDEKAGRIPLAIFNSVISRDGRKMMISSQPISFLMQPAHDSTRLTVIDPDAVDFTALFEKQNPMNLRILTALRMNATFPYILPNVWLPTNPVIDVMDAGLRDNYGQETSLRFVEVFHNWIKENTGGVVMIQIRDRKSGGWENPFESNSITEIVTKPMLLLQSNWYKMQDYAQSEELSLAANLLGDHFYKIAFQYVPQKEDARAALNFHLTKREKQDIGDALNSSVNQQAMKRFMEIIQRGN
jgi:hypothetical protein